jgi:hypothetical protein
MAFNYPVYNSQQFTAMIIPRHNHAVFFFWLGWTVNLRNPLIQLSTSAGLHPLDMLLIALDFCGCNLAEAVKD